MKRVMGLLVAVLVAAIAVPGVAMAQTGGPIYKDPVVWHQQWVDAINAGNATAAAALLADNVTMSGGLTCSPTCVGKAAVQREIAAEIAGRVNIRRTAASAFVGEVTSQEEHRADLVRAAGVERVIVMTTVKFRDEKIASIQVVPDARDAQTARFIQFVTSRGAGATAAAPAVVPARLPSTGSAGFAPSGNGFMALAILVSTLALGGLTVARRRS